MGLFLIFIYFFWPVLLGLFILLIVFLFIKACSNDTTANTSSYNDYHSNNYGSSSNFLDTYRYSNYEKNYDEDEEDDDDDYYDEEEPPIEDYSNYIRYAYRRSQKDKNWVPHEYTIDELRDIYFAAKGSDPEIIEDLENEYGSDCWDF